MEILLTHSRFQNLYQVTVLSCIELTYLSGKYFLISLQAQEDQTARGDMSTSKDGLQFSVGRLCGFSGKTMRAILMGKIPSLAEPILLKDGSKVVLAHIE